MTVNVDHHWSGWPGAYCLHCHCEDPNEKALVDGWIIFEFDDEGKPTGSHFDTPEHEAQVRKAMICPIGFNDKCGQCKERNIECQRSLNRIID